LRNFEVHEVKGLDEARFQLLGVSLKSQLFIKEDRDDSLAIRCILDVIDLELG